MTKADDILAQEPCEDCVSRQAVLQQINCWIGSGEYRYAMSERFLVDRIKTLSSVNPQKSETVTEFADRCRECGKMRKGHWIMTSDYLTTAYGSIDYVKCSCCGEDSLEEGDFCPNCGAKMKGDTE